MESIDGKYSILSETIKIRNNEKNWLASFSSYVKRDTMFDQNFICFSANTFWWESYLKLVRDTTLVAYPILPKWMA